MKILVACEFSQVVTKAFRDKGHEAYSCDILPTEGNPDWHYQCDVLEVLDNGWDMMIAHPSCQYLSNAGARFLWPGGVLNRQRYEMGMEARVFFMRLWEAPIDKICIENPIPSKIYSLPQYDQIIQPYYFGDNYQKRTCLWLKNLPKLTYTIPDGPKPESTKVVGNWFNKGGKGRQKERARTFPGIARNFAEQWG